MAAKKAKKTKKSHRRVRYMYRRRRWGSPEERKWRLWMHDVDTLLHEMVKNPAHNETPPEQLVSRAVEFADAYHAMQDRRRPSGIEEDE